MKPESENLSAYLADEEYLDISGPAVRRRAKELFLGASRDVEAIKAVFDYVADTIPHSADIGSRRVSASANDVIRFGEGMCYAKTMLVAALLRGQGIPTGFVYQKLLRGEAPGGPYAIHALNAAYIAGSGAWALIDARGNANGVKATFDPAKPFSGQLAFAPRLELGECLYPTIYAAHHPAVLEPLRRFDDCRVMLEHLPDSL